MRLSHHITQVLKRKCIRLVTFVWADTGFSKARHIHTESIILQLAAEFYLPNTEFSKSDRVPVLTGQEVEE